ncbi:polysaccharide deacetylase family protein [Antarcticibacterium arcticum]|uniref:Polysaccharide deacetylase family protein n=1 Tax=Antarcticibacterium arcticum TaxID=2585771 RepID=A0A5B8YQ75_9FLAO|nr:polysaccharide deacetylase family protein [Antarcticibacterium arcticum]QED38813.1 polysaccharide deacetylase family protein [Antarcticibacterium arcticum]
MTSINRFIATAGRIFFPSLLWNKVSTEKILYLTFDDGPIPEVTPWVLSLLKEYDAKATFFCIGDNVHKHPDVFKMILADGHRIGNHTFNHLNGWKTSSDNYLENILQAERTIRDKLQEKLIAAPPSEITKKPQFHYLKTPKERPTNNNSQQTTPLQQPTSTGQKLFRPPFGKITPIQIRKLEQQDYKIVMWDVISEDYNPTKNPESCLKEVKNFSKPGSIVVFHDSLKAYGNLKIILPSVLQHYSQKGYEFKAL